MVKILRFFMDGVFLGGETTMAARGSFSLDSHDKRMFHGMFRGSEMKF